jgi:biotin operon repressor|nr:MAG TPA: replisome organizer [Caudoviricetes sp.]
MDNTFIKLSRKIQSWRWYQDANTMRVFVHILLNANVYDHDFENITVKRGQWVTSVNKISEQLNISTRSIRTALNHLKSTNEVAIKTTPKYSIITVKNYNQYQKVTKCSTINRQTDDKQVTNDRQQYKKGKERKRREERDVPSFSEVEQFARTENLNVDAKKFFDYYKERKWQIADKPIDDWKSLLKIWSKNEHKTYASGAYDGVPTISREEFLRLKKEAEENDEWD